MDFDRDMNIEVKTNEEGFIIRITSEVEEGVIRKHVEASFDNMDSIKRFKRFLDALVS